MHITQHCIVIYIAEDTLDCGISLVLLESLKSNSLPSAMGTRQSNNASSKYYIILLLYMQLVLQPLPRDTNCIARIVIPV